MGNERSSKYKTRTIEIDGQPVIFWRNVKSGYYQNPRHGYMHRVVWEMAHGLIPDGFSIHHIDGDRGNNSLDNLKLMSLSEHTRMHSTAFFASQPPERWKYNQPKQSRAEKMLARAMRDYSYNVYKQDDGFVVKPTINHTRFYLGFFSSPDTAHAVLVDFLQDQIDKERATA